VRQRHERIMSIAETLLFQEGEQSLQMRDLAARAGVSLSTLYQSFPSKDHLLAAIALERQHRMRAKLETVSVEGQSPGERVSSVLLDELRYVQRHPEIAAAFQRVTNAPNRSTSEYVAEIRISMQDTLTAAIVADGKGVTAEQREVLPAVLSVAYGAISGWLSGMLSVDQAKSQIRLAARLLDMPGDAVRQYLLDV
jgi:AcrR family transcriptional regulator